MGDWVFFVLIFGGTAALMIFMRLYNGGRPEDRKPGIEVPIPLNEALDRLAVAAIRAGHTLELRTENSLSFVRRQKPSKETAAVLLPIFVLPGVLYLLLGAKTLRASVVAFPNDVGGSRIVIGGDDAKGVSRLTDWARSLR